jgi:hypothetical protein
LTTRLPWPLTASSALVLAAAGLLAVPAGHRAQPGDPFAFFRPTVNVTRDDLQRLNRGDVLVRTLAHEPGEVVVFAAVRTTADGPRLAAWIRDIADLKRSPYVTLIARFSDPPRLADLEPLRLDDDEVKAARRCRTGDCDFTLSSPEIAALQEAARTTGPSARAALDDAFRRIVLARLTRYLSEGDAGLPALADHDPPVSVRDTMLVLERRSGFLTTHFPRVADYLARFPHAAGDGLASLAYWSREQIGGQPSVNATHVVVVQSREEDLPETLVVGKQIFASHYVSASIAFTAIVRGRMPDEHYLVYLNRSQVDVLDRWYAGLARMIIERRLRSDAAGVFRALKARLESGDPPR